MRRQVARRENIVIIGPGNGASHGKSLTARQKGTEKRPGCTGEVGCISETQEQIKPDFSW